MLPDLPEGTTTVGPFPLLSGKKPCFLARSFVSRCLFRIALGMGWDKGASPLDGLGVPPFSREGLIPDGPWGWAGPESVEMSGSRSYA